MDGGVGAGMGQAGDEGMVGGVPEPQMQLRAVCGFLTLVGGVAVGGEFAGDGAGPVRHVQGPRLVDGGCVRSGPYAVLCPEQQRAGRG
jgi:hypothetical protein